ncbi:hypothetical protein FKM82_007732 [Ascaphus truei]
MESVGILVLCSLSLPLQGDRTQGTYDTLYTLCCKCCTEGFEKLPINTYIFSKSHLHPILTCDVIPRQMTSHFRP